MPNRELVQLITKWDLTFARHNKASYLKTLQDFSELGEAGWQQYSTTKFLYYPLTCSR